MRTLTANLRSPGRRRSARPWLTPVLLATGLCVTGGPSWGGSGVTLGGANGHASGQDSWGLHRAAQRSRARLPEAIPAVGAVPPIYDEEGLSDLRQLEVRATVREYDRQIRAIARRCFRGRPQSPLRREGLAELQEFIDPAAFRPLVRELVSQPPDVVAAMLDHLAAQGDEGQAALAYAVIHHGHESGRGGGSALREQAAARLNTPPSHAVLREIDLGLRDRRHAVANAAGWLAGHLDAIQAVPLLIFAQATSDPVEQTGDLAWIFVGTTTSYVANLVPAVGDNAGAFQPVIGTINEGTLLRVIDAVAIAYRTEVHRALVSLTSAEWGQPTAHLGYNMKDWWTWHNEVYVPFKREQEQIARLVEQMEQAEREENGSGQATESGLKEKDVRPAEGEGVGSDAPTP